MTADYRSITFELTNNRLKEVVQTTRMHLQPFLATSLRHESEIFIKEVNQIIKLWLNASETEYLSTPNKLRKIEDTSIDKRAARLKMRESFESARKELERANKHS